MTQTDSSPLKRLLTQRFLIQRVVPARSLRVVCAFIRRVGSQKFRREVIKNTIEVLLALRIISSDLVQLLGAEARPLGAEEAMDSSPSLPRQTGGRRTGDGGHLVGHGRLDYAGRARHSVIHG